MSGEKSPSEEEEGMRPRSTSWAQGLQRRSKGQLRGPSSFVPSENSPEQPASQDVPPVVSNEEWEFSKGVAEATKSISLHSEKLGKKASWSRRRESVKGYESEDTFILEFEREKPNKSAALTKSTSSQSLQAGDDTAAFEIVKVYGSVLRESEKSKKLLVANGTSTANVIQEILTKYKIEDTQENYCLVAVDDQHNEVAIPDDECPLRYHPDFCEPGNLDRHLSFHVRKRKQRNDLETTNERLFKQIMGDEPISLDFSKDMDAIKAVEWNQSQEKRKGKKSNDLLNEIMEETLALLEEQIDEYQARLFSQQEPQESHYYKDMLNKALSSFDEVVRQASVTLKRFQALQQKEAPLVIATRGYNVESLPQEDEKPVERKPSKRTLSNSSSNHSLASPSKEKRRGMKNSPSLPDMLTEEERNREERDRDKERDKDRDKDRDKEKEKEKEKEKDKDKERDRERTRSRDLSSKEPESFIDDDQEPYFHKLNNMAPYRSHFWDKTADMPISGQLNFLGEDPKLGPICVSVLKEKDKSKFGRFRVLIWTKEGCFARFLPALSSGNLRGEILAELISMKFSPKSHLTWVPEPELCHALIKVETDQVESTYKFGVLYVKEGQTREDDMFSNNEPSQNFQEFLGLLGSEVRLLDWKKYRGGLDVTGDSTGTHSVYRKWKDIEIMFHVSTMLPFDPHNPQQLGRKRHIGNDIGVIIFVDGKTPYLPDTVTSRFNHVFIIVRPNPDKTYSVEIAAKDTVPLFGPRIARRKFPRDAAFIDFLLAKIINGQNAAYRAPAFQEKLRRTREFLINDLMSKFLNSGPMASPKKGSDNQEKNFKEKVRTFVKKNSGDMTASPSHKIGTFRMPKFKRSLPLLGSASVAGKLTRSSFDVSEEESSEDEGPSNFFNSKGFLERRESAPVRKLSPSEPQPSLF